MDISMEERLMLQQHMKVIEALGEKYVKEQEQKAQASEKLMEQFKNNEEIAKLQADIIRHIYSHRHLSNLGYDTMTMEMQNLFNNINFEPVSDRNV